LRAGRLLIPYLKPGHYFGLEPNASLVEDGLDHELGREIVSVKQPTFLHHDTFGTAEFGRRFDYLLAHSIATHAGPDILVPLLRQFRNALTEDGIALVTFLEARKSEREISPSGWAYPEVVRQTRAEIKSAAREAGLFAARLRWRLPRQRWYVLAPRRSQLPGLRLRVSRGLPG
jgi:hypothetical protein